MEEKISQIIKTIIYLKQKKMTKLKIKNTLVIKIQHFFIYIINIDYIYNCILYN